MENVHGPPFIHRHATGEVAGAGRKRAGALCRRAAELDPAEAAEAGEGRGREGAGRELDDQRVVRSEAGDAIQARITLRTIPVRDDHLRIQAQGNAGAGVDIPAAAAAAATTTTR